MAKVESFERQQLLDCGYGKMFGHGNARLPVGNMPMMDRINHISDEGGEPAKATSSRNSISIRTCGSLNATSLKTPSCLAAWARRPVAAGWFQPRLAWQSW